MRERESMREKERERERGGVMATINKIMIVVAKRKQHMMCKQAYIIISSYTAVF